MNTIILSLFSLSGGQGKTTISLMLARKLSRQKIRTLLIDADPQASLTTFAGISMEKDIPSLLEVLTFQKFNALNAVISLEDSEAKNAEASESNLFVIPSDNALNSANVFLAESGRSLFVLREKISDLSRFFDVIIIDSPPQRSHLALTVLGASDEVLVPTEACAKGAYALENTLSLFSEQKKYLSYCQLLGIVPFRTKWVGNNITKEADMTLQAMEVISQNVLGSTIKIFPSVRESEYFRKALNKRVLPSDLGGGDVEYPIEAISNEVIAKLNQET